MITKTSWNFSRLAAFSCAVGFWDVVGVDGDGMMVLSMGVIVLAEVVPSGVLLCWHD
jgi:hypothetical protein